MSSASNIQWAMTVPGLRPSARLVLAFLGDRAGDGTTCRPTIATIATEIAISERTVFSAIRQLVTAGVLEVDRFPPRVHVYHLKLHPAAARQPRRVVREIAL